MMERHLNAVLARPDVSERVKRQFRSKWRIRTTAQQLSAILLLPRGNHCRSPGITKITRAEIILESLPGYYAHFSEQLAAETAQLTHVRGGSLFGDMAVEVLSSLVEQGGAIHTLNVPNHTALPDFAPDRIVEVPARLERRGATPLVQEPLPSEVVGLLHMLAEYQGLAANAILEAQPAQTRAGTGSESPGFVTAAGTPTHSENHSPSEGISS